MREDARDAASRVDEKRLWQRHVEMARIGAIPNNGVNRAGLWPEDVAARTRLLSWAAQVNSAGSADGTANRSGRRVGPAPVEAPVLPASHMNSRPRGGRFIVINAVSAVLGRS